MPVREGEKERVRCTISSCVESVLAFYVICPMGTVFMIGDVRIQPLFPSVLTKRCGVVQRNEHGL